MSVFNIFQTIGFYGFNNWVPSLLVKQGITVSTSLGYTTVIALAAPLGPLIGFFLGDRLERKWIIVASAGAILVCGLIFGQARDSALIIAMGVALTLAANIMSFSFHAYQQECSRPAFAPAPPASSIPGAGPRSFSHPSSSPSCSSARAHWACSSSSPPQWGSSWRRSAFSGRAQTTWLWKQFPADEERAPAALAGGLPTRRIAAPFALA
jgi:hypothetical protein